VSFGITPARSWCAAKALNAAMTVLVVEGRSHGSSAERRQRPWSPPVRCTRAPRPTRASISRRPSNADDAQRAALVTDLAPLRSSVRSQKLGEVAAGFDSVHSIERAVQVGSVDAIISARELRPRLVAAVEQGLAR
jgi:hypothetical protein